MTTVSQEAREAEVTQADREAALPILCHLYVKKGEEPALFIAEVKAGKYDDHYQIQALARHRHQAERETLARMEPVAWMYEREGHQPQVSLFRWRDIVDGKLVIGCGDWTETPLYALPPAPEAGQ